MVSKQKILLILLIFVIISLSLENTVSAINLTSFFTKNSTSLFTRNPTSWFTKNSTNSTNSSTTNSVSSTTATNSTTSSNSTNWYTRYDYNSSQIRTLINTSNNIQSKQNVEPVKKYFDLIIFMGETNMLGKGTKDEAVKGIDGAGYEIVFNSSENPYGLKKINEPFGNSNGSMVTAFMNAYYNNTGVPVIGIPAAISTSSIYNTWQPNKNGLEEAKEKFEKSYNWLTEHSYKIRHSYMVWYQGETDVGRITYNNLTYENALKNTVTEMQNVGVERCFMIRMGNLYIYKGTESKYKNRYEQYREMIDEQTRICEENDWITLISTSTDTLSRCENMMQNQITFTQEALNIIGSEAGKNAAQYADQARRKTLTQEQSDNLINFAKTFSNEGAKSGILAYGISAKYKAYNLQSVYYGSQFTTVNNQSIQLIYFGATGKDANPDGGTKFIPGNYIGLDCSGYISFLYHHVFGLSFDYLYNGNQTPWTTQQFIDNYKSKTLDGRNEVDTFKYVYEQHYKDQKYSFNDLASLTELQPGDLLVGQDDLHDGINHIVMYAGKDINGKDKIIHATSNPKLYNMTTIKNGKIIYRNMGDAYLEDSVYKYTDVYVLRLNEGLISEDFGGNVDDIQWDKISNKYPYNVNS